MSSPVDRGTAVSTRHAAVAAKPAGADPWRHRFVVPVVARLEAGLGVTGFGDKYGGTIVGQPWGDNPGGFRFTCEDRAALIATLAASTKFARRGPSWADRILGDTQFREISNAGSLHVIIPRNQAKPCVVHLDSVSIVERRDQNGAIIYRNANAIQRHLALDYDFKRLHFDVDESRLTTALDGERGTHF